MIKFLNLNPETFGLDISDLSLKIIKLKRNNKSLSLVSFGETQIKPGIIEKGELKNEKALADIIRTACTKVNGEKLNTKYVVVSLPEEKTFVQIIKMPKMKREELSITIPLEAENYIPLPINNVYLDYQLVHFNKNLSDKLDVLVVALPKNIVDPYVSCLKQAGLSPLAMEIESYAITRALVKDGKSSVPLVLVDFGRNRTNFIIYYGCSLCFTSLIPVSSQDLTEAISKNLKISLEQAEKLKLEYDLKSEKNALKSKKEISSNGKVFQAMLPILTELAEQIKRYLTYYQTHSSNKSSFSSGKAVKKIIFCGRGANLSGLTDFLSPIIGIPVELGNPLINIMAEPSPARIPIASGSLTGGKEAPGISFKESLGYTTALGLALREIPMKPE